MLEGGGATCSRSHAAARSRTVGYTRGKDRYLRDARNQPRGICKTKISLPEREDGRVPGCTAVTKALGATAMTIACLATIRRGDLKAVASRVF